MNRRTWGIAKRESREALMWASMTPSRARNLLTLTTKAAPDTTAVGTNNARTRQQAVRHRIAVAAVVPKKNTTSNPRVCVCDIFWWTIMAANSALLPRRIVKVRFDGTVRAGMTFLAAMVQILLGLGFLFL